MMKLVTLVLIPLLLASMDVVRGTEPLAVEFTGKLGTVMKHDDDKFHWFHPRAAAIPSSPSTAVPPNRSLPNVFVQWLAVRCSFNRFDDPHATDG